MMKLISLLSVFFMFSVQQQNVEAFAAVSGGRSDAFALRATSGGVIPDHDDSMVLSRRNMMRKGASSALLSLSVASVLVSTPNSALADIYDDQEKARKLKAKEDAENAKKLVPTILFGGVALSVPFFLPNLLRLGKKFISGGKDDGYGGPQ
mmetsp:Transcript_24399/g.51500  ORF Transcript_24399/g.51500 Transcript_24399/m.51500 type:complete len:151 (-) Transcript_24399:179-631(-)